MRSPARQPRTVSAPRAEALGVEHADVPSAAARPRASGPAGSSAQRQLPGRRTRPRPGPAAPPRAAASASRARAKRSTPYSTTARTPPPTSSVALPPPAPSASSSPTRPPTPATGAPAASSASRITTSRASAGGSAARCVERDPRAAGERDVDDLVEHRRPRRAGSRRVRSDVLRRPRVHARELGQHAVADPPAREALAGVRAVLAPAQAALAAVGGGLLAREREQRPHQPAVARRDPEQRAAAGRGGEAVEHGLGLVGRRVAGRDQRTAGELERARVAHVARPRLQVAAAGRRAARAITVQRTPSARAQLADGARVARRTPRRAGRSRRAAPRPAPRPQMRDQHVEQADRVAAARHEREHAVGRRDDAAGADALEHRPGSSQQRRRPRR